MKKKINKTSMIHSNIPRTYPIINNCLYDTRFHKNNSTMIRIKKGDNYFYIDFFQTCDCLSMHKKENNRPFFINNESEYGE